MASKEEQHDVDTKTEIAAERIAHELGMEIEESVIARSWPGDDEDTIIVSWEEDVTGVNSFHKASVIDDVYQSGANVRLHNTDDDNSAVWFRLRD